MSSSFMFGRLHASVLREVQAVRPKVWWKKKDTDAGMIQDYETNIMGNFTCPNSKCKKTGWGSKKVAIRIRSYSGNGYNAVVYNQRCQSCKTLGRLAIDEESYVERVAYRLKKWAGVHVQRPEYGGSGGPPHMRDLCEGCKSGHCQRGD
ncbi:hypothetical protein M011DRAFT_470102 [Sporormia fimetaria CBS 119925]|uniref:3CxxC-type domain-containing protein n=1 Tax=Sporormia fimetaria CBS 119925 TaxID=1340428 RepID=A0A6A6V634_9PLEO|nr:hypothetical protein M011DRAFT_470102 [Sporormia fimetaria CBS 119925]